MRAVVYDDFGAEPEIREVADPVPPPGGAVVRVAVTGLCRSDWHAWKGYSSGIALPHVPGHEFAGTVAAVGSGVTGWRPGDRVTAPFVCACGSCPTCLAGDHQVCERQQQPGFDHWGTYAEFVVAATGGGAHVSTDALGSADTCAASILSLRRRGRQVQIGLLSRRPVLPIDRIIGYELEIRGSHGMAAHAYPQMLRLVSAGILR